MGCQHEQYEDDGVIAFGWNLGGYFCPFTITKAVQQGFQMETEDDETSNVETSDDDIIYLKTMKKGGQSSVFVWKILLP